MRGIRGQEGGTNWYVIGLIVAAVVLGIILIGPTTILNKISQAFSTLSGGGDTFTTAMSACNIACMQGPVSYCTTIKNFRFAGKDYNATCGEMQAGKWYAKDGSVFNIDTAIGLQTGEFRGAKLEDFKPSCSTVDCGVMTNNVGGTTSTGIPLGGTCNSKGPTNQCYSGLTCKLKPGSTTEYTCQQ